MVFRDRKSPQINLCVIFSLRKTSATCDKKICTGRTKGKEPRPLRRQLQFKSMGKFFYKTGFRDV